MVEPGAAAASSPASDDSSDSGSSGRPRRRLDQFFTADAVPWEEIQAQEAELARLRTEKALAESLTVGTTKSEPAAKGTVDLCSSSEDDSAGSMSDTTVETRSVKRLTRGCRISSVDAS
ncbi:hypothetical protein P43SY_011126 [Pythium insidiosum]|uniref:Uncharacterized protein n=1 Tax=Pythium insidiosum TaxID=114742 RepID=A0AAD5Q3E6_PYTIN|nr:hypothetical protein P43SY_011126 [Pythium insidiosum]